MRKDYVMSPETAAKVTAAQDALGRIRQSEHWADWLYVGEALVAGVREIKELLGIGENAKPNGRQWSSKFGQWLYDAKLSDAYVHKSTRSRLLLCMEHREAIDKWRIGSEHQTLNHPVAVWARYSAEMLKPKPTGKAKAKGEDTGEQAHAEELQAAYESAKDEIADLKAEITSLKSGAPSIPDEPAEAAKVLIERGVDWARKTAVELQKLIRAARAAAAKQSRADVAKIKAGEPQVPAPPKATRKKTAGRIVAALKKAKAGLGREHDESR